MAEDMKKRTFVDFIKIPQDSSNVQDWYFRRTGGNHTRLQLGYLLARDLDRLHKKNQFFGCIKPEDIGIASFNPLKLSLSGKHYHYDELPVEYTDPMIYTGNRHLSADSEIYSYAVILFQMLAQYHPFKGAEYQSCSEKERDNGLRNGLFDYIGDYSKTNTEDEFEYYTHLHLNSHLSDLFFSMFVAGKTEKEKRPTLQDFMRACLQGMHLSLHCEHDDYNAEYYGEKSFVCPYCKKINEPNAELMALRKVHSDRRVILPNPPEGDLLPAETDWEFRGRMFMQNTECRIPRSLFNNDISYDAERVCLVIGIHSGCIQITNKLKNLSVIAGAEKKEILPGRKAILSSKEKKAVVSFKTNLFMDQAGEELLDLKDPVYGKIDITYCLLVRKGGAQS